MGGSGGSGEAGFGIVGGGSGGSRGGGNGCGTGSGSGGGSVTLMRIPTAQLAPLPVNSVL